MSSKFFQRLKLLFFSFFVSVIFFNTGTRFSEASAAEDKINLEATNDETNIIEELNPFAPDIEDQLNELDKSYEKATDKPAWLPIDPNSLKGNTCYRSSCKVFIHVRKSDQRAYLFVDGNPAGEFLVSTGARGHETPNFDRHPNGRIYDKYSSNAYPGGDYKGLGNMPYAVFIEGGFALHGTTQGNFKRLGTRASHGCIRFHPDNALIINRLVRQYGIANTWVQVD